VCRNGQSVFYGFDVLYYIIDYMFSGWKNATQSYIQSECKSVKMVRKMLVWCSTHQKILGTQKTSVIPKINRGPTVYSVVPKIIPDPTTMQP